MSKIERGFKVDKDNEVTACFYRGVKGEYYIVKDKGNGEPALYLTVNNERRELDTKGRNFDTLIFDIIAEDNNLLREQIFELKARCTH